MALSDPIRQAVFRWALQSLPGRDRVTGPGSQPAAITAATRYLVNAGLPVNAGNVQSAINTIRSAAHALEAGQTATANPLVAPTPSDVPIDPNLRTADRQYQYRIVLSATSPITNTTTTSLRYVSSDSLLSAEEAIRIASDLANPQTTSPPPGRKRGGPLVGGIVSATVLNVGRRG